jgi:chaperonin GroEL (HSP60 family)
MASEGDAGASDPSRWSLRDAEARRFVVEAAAGVRSIVESTLGPTGLESAVLTEDHQGEPETVVTADAAELLDAIDRGGGLSHPVAALLVDYVDSMQRGVRDGTTRALLLAGALISRGADLVEEGVHPETVVLGYAMAAAKTGETLDELAEPSAPDDLDLLRSVARTAMTADLDPAAREAYAEAVATTTQTLTAASETGWPNTDDAKIVATTHAPTRPYRGVVVRRWPHGPEADEDIPAEYNWTLDVPRPLEDVTVAAVDAEIDFEKTATAFGSEWSSGVSLDSAAAVRAYREGLDARLTSLADRLADLGVDVLVSQPTVDAPVRAALHSRGVRVVDDVRTPKADLHRIARATGASVVSHPDDIAPETLGTAGRVVERRVGGEKWAIFDNCDGGVLSLVVEAETASAADRLDRVVDTALESTAMAVRDGQVLPGAGAPSMAAAAALREYSAAIAGKEQLAVEAFAEALVDVVRALARNGGYDPLDVAADLRAAHSAKVTDAAGPADGTPAPLGLSLANGEPMDAYAAGVVEPRRVFSQAVETARAAAVQLLTVDAVLHPGVDLGSHAPKRET